MRISCYCLCRNPGLLCLKGGNINDEIKPFKHIADVTEISSMFDEEWFKQKYLIYLGL